jgi:cysteinyl-tRNA synthetase
MSLRVYNTLTQTKEPFREVASGRVGMYVCGPTVYSKSHVGHMTGPVIFDTVKRYLTYLGYRVTWVVNITDVDDKLIVQAAAEGTTVKELAERVTADYLECLSALGVDGIDVMPRATDHIGEILTMIQSLIQKGFAYASDGDVYFDVTKSKDYGKLSRRDPDELQAGARVEPSSKKHHPGDFALWKSSKPGEPAWESPWGAGRPGWHIECSAMSMKYLGEHFDIHGGGVDLVFPHHENEIAQSEAFSDRTFASYWMHNGLLTKEGKKISKSDPGTVVLMSDLLKLHRADTLRALYLSSHYRRPTDYGPSRLDEISRGLQTFLHFFERYERIARRSFYDLTPPARREEIVAPADAPGWFASIVEHRRGFLDAMDDDFNTGGALGELHELVRLLNRVADSERLESTDRDQQALAAFDRGVLILRELTAILGLFRKPSQTSKVRDDRLAGSLIELLINLRARVRKEKNFALADTIRDELSKLGVALEDRPEGTTWRLIDTEIER